MIKYCCHQFWEECGFARIGGVRSHTDYPGNTLWLVAFYISQTKKALNPQDFLSAADRNRTGTGIATHGILSPGRLPVPPLRLNGAYRARTCDPLLVRQMLSQLS